MTLLLLGRCVAALILVFVLTTNPARAEVIYFGIEDIAMPQGGERDRNDLMGKITGNGLSVLGAGSWLPMGSPNESGNPFYNEPSWDGEEQNAAYFMTGTGAFVGDPRSPAIPHTRLQYWGMRGGQPSNSFWFRSGGGTVQFSILAEISAWSGINQLYLYDAAGNPNDVRLIFDGTSSAGATVSFTPPEMFVMAFVTPDGNFPTRGDGRQWMLTRDASAVPEPSSLVLLGTSLLGLAFVGRRRILRR